MDSRFRGNDTLTYIYIMKTLEKIINYESVSLSIVIYRVYKVNTIGSSICTFRQE